jgi:hypothetical protein
MNHARSPGKKEESAPAKKRSQKTDQQQLFLEEREHVNRAFMKLRSADGLIVNAG